MGAYAIVIDSGAFFSLSACGFIRSSLNFLFYLDLDHHVHPCGKRMIFVRLFGKNDFYRNTLGDLHKVAAGVVRAAEGRIALRCLMRAIPLFP